MPKYNDLFPPDAVTYHFGFIRMHEFLHCVVCEEITHWYNNDFRVYLCSQECELKWFEKEVNSPDFETPKEYSILPDPSLS